MPPPVPDALPAEAVAESLSADELDAAAATLLDSYDPAWGGFGSAPKFPPSMNLLQLLSTFVRLGGTTSAGEGSDDGDPVAEAKRTGRLNVLGADGHLTG
ncbi:hypothetical protein, partial [Burkholderia multivorans]|uniref:hypothetical protein n=1 Tax=Burkholderia multivorans TaxID=87883 RepID=UPI001C65C264